MAARELSQARRGLNCIGAGASEVRPGAVQSQESRMLSPFSPRLLSTVLAVALSAAAAPAALAAPQEAPRAPGKEGAPEAACKHAVKAALPNPASFKWVGATAPQIDKDHYSVVADVEYRAQDGAVREAMVQCDVRREQGNRFAVPKLRLPQ
ncbi:conserved protein of unknown function (plasmid) [Cupriavidus taiwanensis]|uniref:DUF2880 domain-containing protein n=2 Tax=Cupriavidus taiwanensis TaxID=164546 RepID=A0A7Z7JFM7_9BURK|nr:DUF2880 domain-containing protein [Cupriavidus taiwanensis]SOZ10111.1 conserved protein of unknown function [Cupriavidus taiwanensis]SOZ12279.1 conserved protein of unknown function [Cupriavidus taiwanensis]SOZ43586.1 conserved protein of unknown function [Cupriavidus taiwanensis]SPC22826.1 conserved protein of unknown function [Cupriavidus taiwanensis]SPD54338.1 conserved protein of unknown function [Cupriavidus taiwanensis]